MSPTLSRTAAAALLLLGVPLAGCALGPVATDPAEAARRDAALQRDCYARGGTWSTQSRVCVGADPVIR